MIALGFTAQKVKNQEKYDSVHVHVSGINESYMSVVMDAMFLFD